MEENLRILKPFLRGFPLVLLVVIAAVLFAKKYLNYVTPMYESTAKLKLADANEGVPHSNLFKNFDVFASANKIAGEIEVLKSTALLEKTLEGLNFNFEIYRVGDVQSVELFGNSPILVEGTFTSEKAKDKRYKLKVISPKMYELLLPGSLLPLTGMFDKPLAFPYGTFFVSLNKEFLKNKADAKLADTYEFEFLSQQKLLAKINKTLDIVPVDKDVPVIRINIKSNVPEKAALFVNKLAETYIYDYIENKYKAANTTVLFLDKQIKDAGDKLAESENKIEDYRNEKSITNIRQETETDLRKLSQLKVQQTNMKMSLLAIEDLNNYIRSGQGNFLELAPNFEAFNDLLSTEMVKNIKKLQADKKDLLLVYTGNDERVKVIDEKIKDLTSYLIESINNTRKNLEVKYEQLNADIKAAEEVFVDVPEKEKMLMILNRDFDLLQGSYNFLNEKKIEAEIAQSAKIAFHKIISFGEISNAPVSPNRSIIVIVSALLALLGSVVIIYSVHFAKAKVNDVYTIQTSSATPVAICTPFLTGNQATENHFLKESIQLELKKIIQNQTTVTFSSASLKEGAHFHALHLAEALVLQGRKVVLADAAGNLNNLHVKPAMENLLYVDLTPPEFTRYSKIKMKACLDSFLAECDVVVVNNQSLADEKIGLLLMSVSSSNLVVLDSRRTSSKQITKMDLLKEEYQLPDVWFVLNRAGYNPGVIKQSVACVKSLVSKLSLLKK
ncbi:hypothetical protein CNR22_22905 [Sphingobacteriaceae bacterium]|nr:hypothetical protein CNR22_22905 [Sphingobacteriaceae bacterium]